MNPDPLMRPAVFPASTNWACKSETHPFMEFVKYKKMPVRCARKKESAESVESLMEDTRDVSLRWKRIISVFSALNSM